MKFETDLPPASREGALKMAQKFAPKMGYEYAKGRNHVQLGHPNVSRLAAAIRVRLILENEVAKIALDEHGELSKCEKFVQEVNWRSYWRSWLEMRPEIWTRYVKARDAAKKGLTKAQAKRIEEIESGESGVAVMDLFARELVETGYMHNHARMWFAAFWIHTEQLPWELGADFFERHLLCACPASNTLSWRWVAGIQTRGKPYLARRSNLEKYCDEFYLSDLTGIERLEKPQAASIEPDEMPEPKRPDFDLELPKRTGKTGLWITEDDLTPETSVLESLKPEAVCISVVGAPPKSETSNGLRLKFRTEAAHDAAKRAKQHWGVEAKVWTDEDTTPAEAIASFAKENDLKTVVMLKPFVGPTDDSLQSVVKQLEKMEVKLKMLRREEDAKVLEGATSGFFKFWQGVKKQGLA